MDTPNQACCNCRNECDSDCVCRAAKKTCQKCKLGNCTNTGADAAEVDMKCGGKLHLTFLCGLASWRKWLFISTIM